jgi:multimeric flavodoxin WrbA
MTEHGWATDEWQVIWERVKAANILVVAGPIWLGDKSSMTKKVIERLYAHSGEHNEQGQYTFCSGRGRRSMEIPSAGTPGGFFGWATPMMTRQVRKSITGDLNRLRACLEA